MIFMYLKHLLSPLPSVGDGEQGTKLMLAKTQKQLAKAYDTTRIITSKDRLKETLEEIYGMVSLCYDNCVDSGCL